MSRFSVGIFFVGLLLFMKWLALNHPTQASRSIASIQNENYTFLEVEEKLNHIHFYYILAQLQMLVFDDMIKNNKVEEIYNSAPYLQLQAIRSEVEDVENDLLDFYYRLTSKESKTTDMDPRNSFDEQLNRFSKISHLHALSLENLNHKLERGSELSKDVKYLKKNKSTFSQNIKSEIEELRKNPQFIIFESNINHISYMMEENAVEKRNIFFPSSNSAGNISGNEFPSKVWSLTFDDGPRTSTTVKILEGLKARRLEATFFQITNQAKNNLEMAKKLRDEGMEIASHSYSHQKLSNVDDATLENEISKAAKELARLHGKKMQFFRLPYGAGVNNKRVREKIAQDGLIHVFWNVDTLDWMAQDPERIVERTIALMKKTPRDSGIILFHDIHERTTLAAPKVMDFLLQEERRVCKLAQIVKDINANAKIVCSKS
jgi:peptidoglycan/xylan/chitin deacetylase (PgdA/CDA1 family)